MWVPAQQMNVYYGQDATLVCVVEAHPDALVYWEFNGQIVQENQGYHMKILKSPPSPKYKVLIITLDNFKDRLSEKDYHSMKECLIWLQNHHNFKS